MGAHLMEKKETQFELVEIEKLIPYVNNARTHSDKQIDKIASSIKEFGFLNPLIISEDNVILCGHGRYYAAKKLGLTKLPCIRESHLTEAQRKAYILADNRLAEDAGWDDELLKVEIEFLKGEDFDVDVIGFDEKELMDLFKTNTPIEDDGFDLSEALKKATFVKTNDIWIVGRHRLMCGNSALQEDVDKLMNGQLADLLLTDPPYGVDYEDNEGKKLEGDDLDEEKLGILLTSAFGCAANVMKKGAPFYIWHADNKRYVFEGACRKIKWQIRQNIIWEKNAPTMGRQDFQWQHEPCLYGWKSGASHFWYKDRSEKTILKFNKPKHNDIHPTMKPLDLFGYQMECSSKEGDIILDLFGGSGTSIISAEKLDRTCYMMEKDPMYASAILRRYVENTNKPEEVYCLRNGKKIPYKDLVIEVETNAKA